MEKHVQHTNPPVDQYPYVRKFPRPIEIFGDRDYQGYHVRGQILKFPYESFGPPLDETIIYNQLQLVVLVSGSHKDAQTGHLQEHYKFGKIISKTQADFDLIKPSLISKIYPVKRKIIEPEELPAPVRVKINDIGIVENDYLKECLSRKQDIILVSLDMPAVLRMDPKTDRRINSRLFYSHAFLAHYFGVPSVYANDVRTWFSNLYDTLVFELDYKGISKKEFFRLLDVVGKFSEWAVIGHLEITRQDIKDIYAFIENVEDSQDPLTRFCFSFLDDLLEDLHQKQIISRCAFCGNAFVFNHRKKYCSLVSEGKDCGKKARNTAFYQKHKETIRPKAKKAVSEFRKFCKEKGAKKKRTILKRD